MVKKGNVYMNRVGNRIYFERVKYVKDGHAQVVDQFGNTGKLPTRVFEMSNYILVWEE